MAMMELSKAVGDLIRAELESGGHTQEWLSEKSGIPMRTLSRRLHKINPSSFPIEELGAIADALSVSMVSLIPSREARSRRAVAA